MDSNNFKEAKKYAERGWYYLAALELAEYFHLNNGNINTTELFSLIHDEEWKIVNEEADKQIEKASNILAYGSVWDEDEILLVLSIVINIRLIENLCHYLDLKFNFNLNNLTQLFSLIDHNNPKNKRAINSAIMMLDTNSNFKNWRELIKLNLC